MNFFFYLNMLFDLVVSGMENSWDILQSLNVVMNVSWPYRPFMFFGLIR